MAVGAGAICGMPFWYARGKAAVAKADADADGIVPSTVLISTALPFPDSMSLGSSLVSNGSAKRFFLPPLLLLRFFHTSTANTTEMPRSNATTIPAISPELVRLGAAVGAGVGAAVGAGVGAGVTFMYVVKSANDTAGAPGIAGVRFSF